MLIINNITGDIADVLEYRGVEFDVTKIDNKTTIESQALTALTNNKTFLALSAPTNAQTLAQVKSLTRQMNGVIRLLLNQLDSIE